VIGREVSASQDVRLSARANHQRPNLPAHLERVADLGGAERRGVVVWPESAWIVGHKVAQEPRYVVFG
jgi:hypothetical protein